MAKLYCSPFSQPGPHFDPNARVSSIKYFGWAHTIHAKTCVQDSCTAVKRAGTSSSVNCLKPMLPSERRTSWARGTTLKAGVIRATGLDIASPSELGTYPCIKNYYQKAHPTLYGVTTLYRIPSPICK